MTGLGLFPNIWLSWDEDDDRLEIFLIYFLVAVDRIHPGMVREMLAVLVMTDLHPTRILASTLNNELDRDLFIYKMVEYIHTFLEWAGVVMLYWKDRMDLKTDSGRDVSPGKWEG